MSNVEDQGFVDAVLADIDDPADMPDPWLASDPESWRVVLVDLLDEIRSDLTAKNVEIKDCETSRAGYPKLIRLKEERSALVDRQRAFDARVRYVKTILPKPISTTPPRHIADPDGSELQQIRVHLKEVFRLLEVMEYGGEVEQTA